MNTQRAKNADVRQRSTEVLKIAGHFVLVLLLGFVCFGCSTPSEETVPSNSGQAAEPDAGATNELTPHFFELTAQSDEGDHLVLVVYFEDASGNPAGMRVDYSDTKMVDGHLETHESILYRVQPSDFTIEKTPEYRADTIIAQLGDEGTLELWDGLFMDDDTAEQMYELNRADSPNGYSSFGIAGSLILDGTTSSLFGQTIDPDSVKPCASCSASGLNGNDLCEDCRGRGYQFPFSSNSDNTLYF